MFDLGKMGDNFSEKNRQVKHLKTNGLCLGAPIENRTIFANKINPMNLKNDIQNKYSAASNLIRK